jgi:streptogramin lyase
MSWNLWRPVGISFLFLAGGSGIVPAFADERTSAVSSPGVAVADLNEDGQLDIAIGAVGKFSEDVSVQLAFVGSTTVQLGNGDGTFQPPLTFTAATPTTIALLSSDEHGVFSLTNAAVVQARGAIVAADFNGDGAPDLAVLHSAYPGTSVVSVLLGNGDGTFQPPATYQIGTVGGRDFFAADLNRDGQPDLIVFSNHPYARVLVLMNNGDGTFGPPIDQFLTLSAPTGTLQAALVVDLRGDGVPDMVVVGLKGPIVILRNNGDGTFTQGQPLGRGNDADDLAQVIVAGDFRHSGSLDLAVFSRATGPQVLVWQHVAGGGFRPAARFRPPRGFLPIAVGDFNNDGNLDLATLAAPTSVPQVLFGSGDGTFKPDFASPITTFGIGGVLPSPQRIVAAPAGLPSQDPGLWFSQVSRYGSGPANFITTDGVLLSPSFTRPRPAREIQRGIAIGPDGNIWYTDLEVIIRGPFPESVFPLPAPLGVPIRRRLIPDIASGPDGNLWFPVWMPGQSNQIDRITPGGVITEFAIPTPESEPAGITGGPDGNVWFTETSGNKIGKIAPDGTITEFPLPIPGSLPFGITSGPDGNLWFTEAGASRLGRITPDGTITEFATPRPALNLTTGPDGNLWFTAGSVIAGLPGGIPRVTAGSVVARLVMPGGRCEHEEEGITEFPMPRGSPSGSEAFAISGGPDGNIWFTQPMSSTVSRLSLPKVDREARPSRSK